MASNPIYGRESHIFSNSNDYNHNSNRNSGSGSKMSPYERGRNCNNPIYGRRISNVNCMEWEEGEEREKEVMEENDGYAKADENLDIAGYIYDELPPK